MGYEFQEDINDEVDEGGVVEEFEFVVEFFYGDVDFMNFGDFVDDLV